MAFKNLSIEDIGEILNDTGYGTAVDDREFMESGAFHTVSGFATGGPTLHALGSFLTEQVPRNLQKRLPELLEEMGKQMVQEAQRMIDEGYAEWPPLSPTTIADKGFDQILFNSGALRDSFQYEVDRNSMTVRLYSDVPYIIYSELGTARTGWGGPEPPRPILVPAMEHVVAKLPRELGRAVEVSFVNGAEQALGATALTADARRIENDKGAFDFGEPVEAFESNEPKFGFGDEE